MGKAWPALDILLSSPDPALRDRLLAAIDDFEPAALEEPDEASLLRVYFTTAQSRDAAARAVRVSFADRVSTEMREVSDDDWAERSQAELGAVSVGTLVIAPPWRAEDYRHAQARLIVIRPSMGFGTGHHATTKLTLEALQGIPLRGRTLIDVGCGSGVLALAAATLGAVSVVGIDVDADALANAHDNLELNGLAGTVRFEQGDLRTLSRTADVVTANLTGALLAGSAKALAAAVKQHGHLLISGFIETEKDAVLQPFDPFFALERVTQEGEWLCATYRSRQT